MQSLPPAAQRPKIGAKGSEDAKTKSCVSSYYCSGEFVRGLCNCYQNY